MSEEPRRPTVGVFPAAAAADLQRLLAALELAFPVRFEGRPAGESGGLDAIIELGDVHAAKRSEVRTLRLLRPEPAKPATAATQTLGSSVQLDRRLRGAELPDSRLAGGLGGAEISPEGATVLAHCGGFPTWTRRGQIDTALLIPGELAPEEALRERLCGTRSAALLPLVHLLREVTADETPPPPPLPASFLFDDPNLHWPTYGFVDLPALAEQARRHGYHAALATVPLDGWFAHPRALRALRDSEGALSLTVHGNDHYGGELGRPRTTAEALALAAQAMRRVHSFERRTGVEVDRVMVPPHERCSQATVAALRRCGFAALSVTQPYPWLGDGGRGWLARPQEAGPLVGWRPAEHVEGLPVLLRHPLSQRSQPELTLRAFLNQPLILYGHQNDLGEGPDVLAEAAAELERLGPIRWCSLGEIAAGAQKATALELPVADAVDPETVPAPRPQPLAIPRRLLSESRDRLAPLLSRTS